MSKYYDKLIEELTMPEPKPRRTEPRTRAEIESFVKGFGLSAAATNQIVSAWTDDQGLAEARGYQQGEEDFVPYAN